RVESLGLDNTEVAERADLGTAQSIAITGLVGPAELIRLQQRSSHRRPDSKRQPRLGNLHVEKRLTGLHDRSVRILRVDLDRLVRVTSASHQSGNVRLVLADNTLHAGGDHLTGKTLNVEGDFLVGERNVDVVAVGQADIDFPFEQLRPGTGS